MAKFGLCIHILEDMALSILPWISRLVSEFARLKSIKLFDLLFLIILGVKVAVKAMQKGKIQDYESFKNEINILIGLVSVHHLTK